MPTYEYECSSCSLHFDRKQRFDEEPVAICPRCQGKASRVLHSIPVLFKGSGFYVTDSRNPGIGEASRAKEEREKEKKED